MKNRNIALVVTKTKFGARKTDFTFWQSRPFSERLEALEQIRSEYHHWIGNVKPGLQRVYRIIKR
jgi:hypothetical protein